jgi:hypothetical protein
MPLRLTVSRRTLRADGAELKPRAGGEMRVVPRSEVVARVQAELQQMKDVILGRVQPEILAS